MRRRIEEITGKEVVDIVAEMNKKKVELLGHIIRTERYDDRDPMRQVTFLECTNIPRVSERLRPGVPRKNWIRETIGLAWEGSDRKPPGEALDGESYAHRLIVVDDAHDRVGAFSGGKKHRIE